MNAMMGKLVTPTKIDISTDDVITPTIVGYQYKLLLDNRSISLSNRKITDKSQSF